MRKVLLYGGLFCISGWMLMGSAFAILKLPDQLDVNGAGVGRVAASFEDIFKEVGYVVDDTFEGEITFTVTLKWDSLEKGSATNSFALFHFFSSNNGELAGIGNRWHASQIGTFNDAGVGGRERSHQSGTEIVVGTNYTLTLVINYHAGAPDTAVINGAGFVNESLSSGNWGFNHIRVRAGGGINQVDFTNMSITSCGTGSVCTAKSAVELVDPRFPAELRSQRRARAFGKKQAWWPKMRIQQLETEREQLLEKITQLPQHALKFQTDHLGYHSSFEKIDSGDFFTPIQFSFRDVYTPILGSIALVPAFNPTEPKGKAYAFPRRFKIEVMDRKTGVFDTVVNWMDEDFPNPGPYPVFFSGINHNVKQIRIIVPRIAQESGMAFYALGEVCFFHKGSGNRIGVNMLSWENWFVESSVSNSFSVPSLWDIQYLSDGVDGLGCPFSDKTTKIEDLLVTFKNDSKFSNKVQLMLDLGRLRPIGRIDFWPATTPYMLALPSFGLPKGIHVEISPDADFKRVKVLNMEGAGEDIYDGNRISVLGEAYRARYIRITLERFTMHKGGWVLGLGEILVSSNEKVWSVGCKIDAQGIPEEYMDQLPRLVDGYSRQRRILPQGEWIKGLAMRRPLDRQLAEVEKELILARTSWRRTQQRLWLGVVVVVFVGLIGIVVFQQRMRKRGINKLKRRITRDLHDDVGSNLGSISFAAEQLRHVVVDTEAETDLQDLSLLAREACASLREVVWVIDEATIRLPALIQKMTERAERVLDEVELSVEISTDCPDCVVSLVMKRHLVMFFKEVIHNCARHAQATQVWLTFCVVDQYLQISVRDNGVGFNTEEAPDGWGLDSMRERAAEMGGGMELISAVEKGTNIMLRVPLANLSKGLHGAYATSN